MKLKVDGFDKINREHSVFMFAPYNTYIKVREKNPSE